MSRIQTKSNLVAGVKQLILGTQKHYPDASSTIQVGGATYTVATLTKLMQDVVDNRAAVLAAQATAKTKIAVERSSAPSQLVVVHAFETIVKASFGDSADVLADFGLSPRKAKTPLTAEQKAVAAAKRLATRAARHTAGKVQKKGVKGTITATLVVTPQSGPQSAAPAPAGPLPPTP